jgi:hypothetical protein
MGIACGFAVNKIFVIESNIWTKICYAVSYLAIITRFFEGNVIFYCKTFQQDKSHFKKEIYMRGKIDLYFIFSQFFIFSAMGHFIGDLKSFIISFIVLNIVDFIWHGFSFLKSEKNLKTRRTSISWCLSNLIFGLINFSSLMIWGKSLYTTYKSEVLVLFTLLGLIFAIFDYWNNKDFYFGDDSKEIFENF